ncbi:MAG: choice-of-anchor V domain-containing protein [Bacteroidia bacterium]
MKKNFVYIIIVVFLSIAIKLLAVESGISGKTGAPSEITCASGSGCHTQYTLNSGTGSVAITHNIPSGGYIPSTTYSITVTVSQTGMTVFGFDLEALNSSNISAGTLAVTSAATMKLMTASNGRSNITHKMDGGFVSNSKAFTFNWTAPSSNIGVVTFYTAAIAGNHNGNENGDYVYSTSLAISPRSSNAITTGTIGTSFCAATTGISIPYTITGTYNVGNVFTAQLSDVAGSFTSPLTIGTLTSTTVGTIISNIALPNTAGTGYRIRVISSNPVITGSINSSNILINASPTLANAGTDQNTCNTSTNLAANTPTTGTGLWTVISGSATVTTTNSATSAVTGLSSGTNTFLWTISNGTCSPTRDTITVIKTTETTISNAGIDQNVCANTTTLNGNIPTVGIGAWAVISGNATLSNSSLANTSVSNLSTGINTFVWAITNAPCVTSYDTVIINKSGQLTTANAGSDQSLCSSSTATLNGNNATIGTGLWSVISGSATFVNASNATTNISGLSYGNNVLIWTISNSGCTPSVDTVIISRTQLPTTSIAGSNQVICNSSTTLGANMSTVGTGLWQLISGTGTITNASNPTTTVTGIGGGNNVFRWTISNAPCTASSSEVTINNCFSSGTIATGNIIGSPFCAATSYSLSVPFTITGTFTGFYSVELSDSLGNFTNSTIIGAGTQSPLMATIPTSTPLGNKYRIRVKNSNPVTNGTDNGTNLLINTCATNSLTTGTIIGSPFCVSTSYSVLVPFNSTGIFNGFYSAELSDSLGNFTSPLTIASGNSSPLSGYIPANTPLGNKYRIRVKNSNPLFISNNNGTDISINNCINNTITTSIINGSPFCENTSYNLQVGFSYTGNFNGYFTAQLSDKNGSFNNPTPIGIGATSPINASIPVNTFSGTNYKIRVVNNNPNTIGYDNGSSLEINNCIAIILDTVSGSPFCSKTSYNTTIPFKTVGTITGAFVAELSDISGNFDSALTIGYGYNNPININIPIGTLRGTSYRVRLKNATAGIFSNTNKNNLSINNCANTNIVLANNFENNFNIYPNPFTNQIELNYYNEMADEMYLVIQNTLGKEVYNQTIQNNIGQNKMFIENLNNLNAGIYFTYLKSKNGNSKSIKLIKN